MKESKQLGGQTDKYGVLLFDHPWDFCQRGHLGAEKHYNVESKDGILGLADAVKSITAEDAHAYMWATNLAVEHVYEVMRAYGFTPKYLIFWAKPRMTLGNTFRNAGEYLLFGTKGKAPVGFKSQPNWFFAPLQDHSHKPEELYEIIERMSGKMGKKIEFFARRRQHGWHAWGNEIDSDVSFADFGYPVPSDVKFSGGQSEVCHENCK